MPDIFPGNVIPTSCQDPVAVDLLSLCAFSEYLKRISLQAVLTGSDRSDQTTFRFDHHINAKQNFSGYYYFTDEDTFNPFNNFQAAGANVPGCGASSKQRFRQWKPVDHTWTISNNVVNEFRFAYMREAQRTFNHSQNTNSVTGTPCASAAAKPFCFTGVSDASVINDPVNNVLAGTPFASKIGITPGLGAQREGVPDITVSGGFTIGNDFEGELPQVGNSFQWSDSLTKVVGNHTMKFGADLRRMRFDQTLYFEVSGYYNYFGGGSQQTSVLAMISTPTIFSDCRTPSQQACRHKTETPAPPPLYLFAQDQLENSSECDH